MTFYESVLVVGCLLYGRQMSSYLYHTKIFNIFFEKLFLKVCDGFPRHKEDL